MKKAILAILFFLSLPVICCQATVSNGTNQVIYAGDGTSTIFPFSFNVYNNASENDLTVSELNTTTGAVTSLSLNTDYTVSLTHATPSPGSITLTGGALAIGTNLSILRQLPLTQLVSEADNSATPAAVRNNVYDRSTMISQQLQQQLTRAVLQSIFATTSITLPAAVANYGLCWDSTATSLTNCASITGTIPIPISNSNLQTLTASNLVSGSSLFGTGTMTQLTLTNLITTGNVGIGSASPGQLLDVRGTIRGTSFIQTGSVANNFTGNVGIGSASPGTVLDVQGSIRSTGFNVNGYSGILGAWVSKSFTTVYFATTDGFLIAYNPGGGGVVTTITDANASPSTVRTQQGGGSPGGGVGMTPVRKGDYYEATTSSGSGQTAWFISIGS